MREPTEVLDNIPKPGRATPVCPVCQNDAVVELKGVVRYVGAPVDRGSAPCKWCGQGLRLARRLESDPRPALRIENPVGYRWEDVVVTDEDREAQAALLDAEVEKFHAARRERNDRTAAAKHAARAEREAMLRDEDSAHGAEGSAPTPRGERE